MEKTFRLIGMVLMAVLMSVGFTACSSNDDDDSNGGNGNNYPNTEAHVIVTNNGNRYLLSSTSNNYSRNYPKYSYYYDEVNKLSKITGDCKSVQYATDYSIQYAPSFKVSALIGESENYKNDSITMLFNTKGYITEITETYSFHNSDYTDTGSRTLKFSYDGQGHLTYISVSGKGTEFDDNGVSKWPYTLNSTLTLTWDDGNLMQTEYNEKQTGDSRPSSCKEIYKYTYGTVLNTYNQNTIVSALPLLTPTQYRFIDFVSFVYIGWLGIGTKNLPNMYAYYKQEEDEEAINQSYKVSYSINNEGLIEEENYGSTLYYYLYKDAALTINP